MTAVVQTLAAAYDPNDIRPGWIALGLVAALGLATFLLWRSMNSQLRRIEVPTKAELAEQRRQAEDASPDGVGGPDGAAEAEAEGSADGTSVGDDAVDASGDDSAQGDLAADPDRSDHPNDAHRT